MPAQTRAQKSVMAKLVIKRDGMPAEVIELKPGTNRLGRSSSNDFQIQHASVSRFHCEVEVRDDALFVRDMDSSNGTYVNGQPVERAQLSNGYVVRIGDVPMEVQDAPVRLEEREMEPCSNHPKLPASMECTQCHRKFCGACIHILQRSGGKILRLCPACSGHCVPMQALAQSKKSFLGDLMDKLRKKKKTGDDHNHD
jgi:hypothetical protein